MSGMFPTTAGSAPQQLQAGLAQLQATGMMKKELSEQEKRLKMELQSIEQRRRDRERSQHVLQKQSAINSALIAGDVDAAMAIWSTYGGAEDGTPQQFGIPESAIQRATQPPGQPAIGAGAPTTPAVGGGMGQPAPATAKPPVTLPGAERETEQRAARTVAFPYRRSPESYRRPSEEYLGRMRKTRDAKEKGLRGRAGSNQWFAELRHVRGQRDKLKTTIDKITYGKPLDPQDIYFTRMLTGKDPEELSETQKKTLLPPLQDQLKYYEWQINYAERERVGYPEYPYDPEKEKAGLRDEYKRMKGKH